MKIKPIEIDSTKDVFLDESGVSSAYFIVNSSTAVNPTVIQDLKSKSLVNKTDIRLCLHSDSKDDFHNMIIVQHKNNHYPPHKHPYKSECYHLIAGELGAVHFDDFGNVTKFCKLGADNNFIYRIQSNEFHVVFPLSDIAIYHESKPGPFDRKEDFVEPYWSPSSNNSIEIKEFNKKIYNIFNQ